VTAKKTVRMTPVGIITVQVHAERYDFSVASRRGDNRPWRGIFRQLNQYRAISGQRGLGMSWRELN
jgi:hypothetical protein